MDAGIRVKTGKLLLASGAIASLLTLTLSGPVLANGTGDLYVASSAGVLEVLVKTSSVINTIPMVPAPQSLAFSPDGRTAFASDAGKDVTPIDIATLDVQAPIVMPGLVSALAFPAGQLLVATMPARRTLAWAVVHGGPVTESAALPGPGNLLAGDSRDARVAVAEAGQSWLDIVDPAAQTLNKVTVSGGIVALAIDRDRGDVLVATQSPNSLVRVDLTSHLLTWTVSLPGAPVAVASMASTIVVAGGTKLWKVDGKTATAFATTKLPASVVTASYDGAYLYVAESAGIEVFDSKGSLQRTIVLKGDEAPVAMAPIPSGSSLFLGHGGAEATPTVVPTGTMPGAITTSGPPTTSTVVDTARDIVGYPPVQDAALVAVAILVLCWLFVRWYDRRQSGLR
jgi:DNA-binding beta-propeller fold protein YncE